jgi:hypothetical protein
MEQLLQNPIGLLWSPGQPIPNNMTVHHVDFKCSHNCTGNLLLLETAIHNALDNRFDTQRKAAQYETSSETDLSYW